MDLFDRDGSSDGPDFPGSATRIAIFFALRLDAASAEPFLLYQALLCDQLGIPRRKMLDPDRLHVSIALPGHPRRLTEPAEVALGRSMERFCFPAFDLVFDRAVRLNGSGGEYAFALEADDTTQEMAHRLRIALADVQRFHGITASRGRHRMHLTLAYGDGIPPEPIAISPVGFRVEEIFLIASPQGEHRHVPLGRWPLAG